MRSLFLFLLILSLFGGCKKAEEDKKPETAGLPLGSHKRVQSLVMYDTLKTKKISRTQFEYDAVSGRLSKSVTSYTNNTELTVSTKRYAYTSFNKVDSYTETVTAGSYSSSSILRFVYDSLHMPVSELSISLPGMQTNATATYTRNGNTIIRTVTYDNLNFTKYYLYRGDLAYYTLTLDKTYYDVRAVEYNYHASVLDKSKLFFIETAPLNAECKLLLSEHYPSSILLQVPRTITYSYVFDSEEYPVEYSNSDGAKWLITYY